MKVVIRKSYGPPAVIQIKDIQRPVPKADEVLVRVAATTVSRTDCGILRGRPWVIRLFTGISKPRRPVLGTDFAGTVEAVGAEVTKFKTGQRVWGFHDEGLSTQAEFVCVSQQQAILPVPESYSFEEIVACAEGAYYAYYFLRPLQLFPGCKVLVNGATGAIGSAALQLLKNAGARVTAVGDTSNLDLLASLGAVKVYDYTREDFRDDADRYHYIFDAVGKSSFGQCKHLLQKNGIYLSSELGPRAENIWLPLVTKIKGGKNVIFPLPGKIMPSLLQAQELLENKKFRPVIDRVYQMEEVHAAYKYVEKGMKAGNVILKIVD